jgi:hypothetical protein
MGPWVCISAPGSSKECFTPTDSTRPDQVDVMPCIRYYTWVEGVGGCIRGQQFKVTYRDYRQTIPCWRG